MAGVAVVRLRVAAPAGRVAEARQRSEDALRIAAGGETRLLVLRRLVLAAMPPGAGAREWVACAEERLGAQRRRAVHGLAAGAEQADAVWFASPAEAEAALLRLLATGSVPLAWFWRLAVPRWRGRPGAALFAELLIEAIHDAPAFAALGRFAVAMLAEGRQAVLLGWLAGVPTPPVAAIVPGAPGGGRGWEARRRDRAPPVQPRAIVARLDPVARTTLSAILAGTGEPASVRAWMARLALAAAAPELVGTPALAAMADALADDVAAAHGVERAEHAERGAAFLAATRSAAVTIGEPLPSVSRAPANASLAYAPVAAESPVPHPDGTVATADAPGVARRSGRVGVAADASAVAGTLLLILSLRRMGIAERLDARPDLLAAGFGRALLAHIARRMGAAEDDPLLLLLGRFAPADPASLTAWRVGLDRWLRRRARIGLAEVARRPGRIARMDDRLDARFQLDAADIRLRRRALDVDPGWVGWLGLAVRYHYGDDPRR